MPKKSSHRKIPVKTSSKNKGGLFAFLKKLFLFSFIATVFFVGTDQIIKMQSKQTPCANSKTCVSDLSLKIDNDALGMFAGKKVTPPKIDANADLNTPVLGAETKEGDKHVYIDLSKQILFAYQGQNLILKTFVSTGKWGRTPAGNFHIWEKLIATRMAGGSGADAYDLPNVPYVMYFFHDFGLHGAYWHDNFGHTMSHGCVNMRQIDAKALFAWAEVGTPVSVCDQITGNNQCIQNNAQ
ncbi:L,D-transpeptidase [Candidatus Gottesmanbacteria bacterium]|nr:L,D-transpeptidase [Candidatus Gottesmanbacteria bacterium]